MYKSVKFKVELEVTLKINVPEGCATYPYTKFGACVNNDGHLLVVADTGKVSDCDIKKVQGLESTEIK